MWPTQKIRSGHSEPWTPGMGKPVVPDELAEPQTARLSAEKIAACFTGPCGEKSRLRSLL